MGDKLKKKIRNFIALNATVIKKYIKLLTNFLLTGSKIIYRVTN